ncbi:MAG: DUF4352 domain-containing protein [Eubacteriales bacterium]
MSENANKFGAKKWLIFLLVFTVFVAICVGIAFAIVNIFSPPSMEYVEKDWGESFTLEGLEIQLNDYEFRYYAKSGSIEAGQNKVWLVINATVYNASSKAIDLNTISDEMIYIRDGEEAKYNSVFFLYSDWIKSHQTIDPYEKIEGMFMYQIPEGIAPMISGHYYNGGRYGSNQTNDIGFEFRIKENSVNASKCIVVKL